MKKLYELLDLRKTAGDFGVEIEVEGNRLLPVEDGVWNTTDDGSLRGVFPVSRAEYVLAKPLPLGGAIKAILSLSKKLKDNGATFNFSYRTSVHVHCNVQEMTQDQYMNFVYAYLILEPVMMRYCGDTRKANRFCLSIQDGEGLMDYLHMIFSTGVKSMRMGQGDGIRYSALNLAATKKYGSLEFRGMRGTMDTNVLSNWLMAIDQIRTFAIQAQNPLQIHDLFVKFPAVDFFRNIFGFLADEFEYEGIEDDLRSNFSVTLELPYTYRHHLFNKKEENPKELFNAF